MVDFPQVIRDTQNAQNTLIITIPVNAIKATKAKTGEIFQFSMVRIKE